MGLREFLNRWTRPSTAAPLKHVKRASIYANRDFICVQTCSGYRLAVYDPLGATTYLAPSTDTDALGDALQMALSRSRTYQLEELDRLLAPSLISKHYEDWVASLMDKFRYTRRSDAFRGMKHCMVQSEDGNIIISPTRKHRSESWTGMDKDEQVLVADTASVREIGAAVMTALDRCLA